MLGMPRGIKRQSGRYALVDGLPFELPVNSERTSALMAGFGIDAAEAEALLPGNEIHAARLWQRAVHFESWILSSERPPETQPEGFESVIDLGLRQDWPEPPKRP